ncbi:hypothetical protein MCOR02_001120 [Pyricularia oryzae]|uniref:Uncharacterized protein n=1 Tax=Pyricularia oryzae TaxID=318829 RepID=A0A4P7NVA0_PYROR|nr:hypothetical protein MCOR02_001120 [Pyricularia oryzae]KAI6632990.1 hypothetical protein MCOR14_006958 [Pyricularia oryzae]QBZ66534.1 hypothetical protein PoMZ_13514 [Pyricularia oryzae]
MAGERGSDEAFVQFSAMADTLWLAMVAISTPPSWEAGSAGAAKCACIVGGPEHEQTHLVPDILTVDEAVTEDVEFFVKCDVNFMYVEIYRADVESFTLLWAHSYASLDFPRFIRSIGFSGGKLHTSLEFVSFPCLSVQRACQRASSSHRVYAEFAATKLASQV